MSMLSHGPFNYNRFAHLDEKAKPDFLDVDNDKNKKESMKKALKDKEGKCKNCGKEDCGCDDKKDKKDSKGKPPWLKEADMSKAPSIKDYKAPTSTPVKYDKKMNVMAPTINKEEVVAIEYDDAAAFLMEHGVCADHDEVVTWLDNATQDNLGLLADKLNENRFAAHQGKSTDAGANRAVPAKSSGKNKTYTMKGKDGKPLFSESSCNSKGKKKVVKEDVITHLIENNYVNNEVSAEAMFNHISDEFLEKIEDDIMEGWKPLPKEKMARQSAKAYEKENSAVRAGDEKEVNKQMQRRIAMNSPSGRKAQLSK